MSLLSGLKTAGADLQEKDVLGGGKFRVVDSGVYGATIKFAYLEKTAKGALALYLGAELDNGVEYKETMYITTGDDKGNTTYSVAQDGTKTPLSDFVNAEAIALFTAQQSLADLDTEEKIVKVYDFDVKKEVPKPVPMITALLGKPVQLGIKKIIENKRAKSGNTWVDTDETKEVNKIDKVFHPVNGKTVPEIRAKKEDAEFIDAWRGKWEGQVHDKSKKVANSSAKTSAGKATTTSKLFA